MPGAELSQGSAEFHGLLAILHRVRDRVESSVQETPYARGQGDLEKRADSAHGARGWPEGSELVVEPISPNGQKLGLTEEEWRDNPEAIAAWEAGVRSIEPPEYSDEERAALARYREAYRQHNL